MSDEQAVASFLGTAHEELKHKVDQHFLEAWERGEIDTNDPTYLHTLKITVNALSYIDPKGDSYYEEYQYRTQYLEETAKEHAAQLSYAGLSTIFPDTDPDEIVLEDEKFEPDAEGEPEPTDAKSSPAPAEVQKSELPSP